VTDLFIKLDDNFGKFVITIEFDGSPVRYYFDTYEEAISALPNLAEVMEGLKRE